MASWRTTHDGYTLQLREDGQEVNERANQMFAARRVAWASLLCAVASDASPGRSVTATRPALKKQIAVESGLPATRLAQKSDGVKEAVTPQHRPAARPALNPRAAREHSVPATSLAAKGDEDDLLHLQTRGGAARREEAQEVAAVKNEKARPDTLHLSAHVQPRPLL